MVSTESSNSFTSKVFYPQSFSNHSSESSPNNFPVNKVMVLPSSSVPKIIPILSSPDSHLVPNKAKYKEREYNDTVNQHVSYKAKSKEQVIRTDNRLVSSSKGKERERFDIRTDNRSKGKEREHNDIGIDNQLVSSKAKNKERDHINITEINFRTVISSTGLKTMQDDETEDMEIDDNIPQPTTNISNKLTETGHTSNQASSNKLTKTRHALNQAPSNKLIVTGHASNGHTLNQIPIIPIEHQIRPVNFVDEVLGFLNSYNYEFDILDIMIDFSYKYQEIFRGDGVYLNPFYNNPCVLLDQLRFILLNKINSGN
jgi:hypothetical protein